MAERVLGVLAGGDMPDEQLRAWAASAEHWYAADSAGDRLVQLGFCPVVVGDLDSFDKSLLSQCKTVSDADPDRTDCDKMLDAIVADGHGAVTVAGIEGDLMDHVLASLTSLVRSPLAVRIVLRTAVGHVLRGGDSVNVPDALGRRVSLIPISRSTGVELHGVLWEVEGATMEPGGFLSVSNEGTGAVSASVRTGAAVLFVGREPTEPPEW